MTLISDNREPLALNKDAVYASCKVLYSKAESLKDEHQVAKSSSEEYCNKNLFFNVVDNTMTLSMLPFAEASEEQVFRVPSEKLR